jgi:hypothetical protein
MGAVVVWRLHSLRRSTHSDLATWERGEAKGRSSVA